MDLLSALDAAADEFERRLIWVPGDGWTRPTPCPDWNVRYLVAHVVGGNRFATLILDGLPASEVIDRVMSTPQLGDDAMAAWTTTTAAQALAFHPPQRARAAGRSSARTDVRPPLPRVPRPRPRRLHAWDLARALGAHDTLDRDLVDVLLGIVQADPAGMRFGITALDRADDDLPTQTRLLHLTGRDPGSRLGDSAVGPE